MRSSFSVVYAAAIVACCSACSSSEGHLQPVNPLGTPVSTTGGDAAAASTGGVPGVAGSTTMASSGAGTSIGGHGGTGPESVGGSGLPLGGNASAVDCDHEVRSIDCFYQRIIASGAKTVEESLRLLPEDLRSALTLMQASRSRHLADNEHPRVIMYGDRGEFIVTVSTFPSDPLYEVFELAELAPNGDWKFRQLTMGENPHLDDDDSACRTCHTARARPIWGQYRTWPGNYPNETDPTSNGDNAARDSDFVARLKASNPARFSSLTAYETHEPLREWSGEVFNYMIGRANAIHISKVMKRSPNYDQPSRYRYLTNLCESAGSNARHPFLERQLRAWGIEPSDTNMGLLASEVTSATEFDFFMGGSFTERSLGDVVILDLIFGDRDEALRRILQPYFDLYEGGEGYPLTQQAYDAYGGQFPHQLPEAGNGAARYRNGQYQTYGGTYGLDLFGRAGAWGALSYLKESRPDLSGEDGPNHAELCSYVSSKL